MLRKYGRAWVFIFLILSESAAAAARGPLSVKLTRQEIPLQSDNGILHHRSAYHGQLKLGGPEPQLFDVVFDTGSGHLVVPSAFCKSETCMRHRRYRRKKSEFAQDIDVDGTPVLPGEPRDEITVAFGTGEVTGIFVQDELCLGTDGVPGRMRETAPSLLQTPQVSVAPVEGADLTEDDGSDQGGSVEPEVPAPQRDPGCLSLRMISATDMTEDPFASFDFDGVLGLGLPGLSQADEFNFVLMGAELGAWTASSPGLEDAFSVFLSSDGQDSEITFGGWKEEHLAPGATVQWCSLRDDELGYWQVDVLGISVNGIALDFCKDGCRAVVDTGTSLLGVPSSLGTELFELLLHDASDEGCSGLGPELRLDLGTANITLTPANYAKLVEVLPDDWENSSDSETSSVGEGNKEELPATVQRCVPMLSHMDLPEPLHPRTLILGEPVLQRYYTTFDAGGLRVGFAEARQSKVEVDV